ncbi:MAG: hemerythrin domain-containing protein [Chloroflexi bacterium]|nr:hemerythrin domain-containing protein [Chloroflexota bacterium]
MNATMVLRNEHDGILAMLEVLEASAYRLKDGKSVPPEMMLNAVDFFRSFADKCHHGKEETELFPALLDHGLPRQGGPVAMMLAEHEQGRMWVGKMKAAAERYAQGERSAVSDLVDSALGYVSLLRAHIEKENGILFPMADQMLSENEQSQLFEAFERIEANEIGPGIHERYHAMIAEYKEIAAEWSKVPA